MLMIRISLQLVILMVELIPYSHLKVQNVTIFIFLVS